MLIFLVGIISGIVTGLGMGGGSILIMFLSSFFGFDQHIAQSANLVFFIPTSIIVIMINLKRKNIVLQDICLVIFFGILGTLIGSKISIITDSDNLKRYFAIFIFAILIYEIYVLIKEYKNKVKKT